MARRWRGPAIRRGKFFPVQPTVAVTPPPAFVAAFGEPAGARPRVQFQRRGRFFAVPVPVAVTPPPAVSPQMLRQPEVRLPFLRRRKALEPPRTQAGPVGPVDRPTTARGVLARRGRYLAVPPAPVVPPPPAWVPPVGRPAFRLRFGVARRGRFNEPPWVGVTIGVGLASGVGGSNITRASLGVPRRGRFAAVPPAPVVTAGPGPLAGKTTRPSTRPQARVRHGLFFAVPLVGLAPQPPPAAPPQVTRPDIRLPFVRRGRFYSPPWPAQAPTVSGAVPAFAVGRRPQTRIIRRGRFAGTPAVTQPPPAPTRFRRPGLLRPPSGTFLLPCWPPPAAPGPLAPQVRSTRRRFGFLARRGRFAEPVWPYVPPPPFSVGVLSGSSDPTSVLTATGAPTAVLTSATTRTGGPS